MSSQSVGDSIVAVVPSIVEALQKVSQASMMARLFGTITSTGMVVALVLIYSERERESDSGGVGTTIQQGLLSVPPPRSEPVAPVKVNELAAGSQQQEQYERLAEQNDRLAEQYDRMEENFQRFERQYERTVTQYEREIESLTTEVNRLTEENEQLKNENDQLLREQQQAVEKLNSVTTVQEPDVPDRVRSSRRSSGYLFFNGLANDTPAPTAAANRERQEREDRATEFLRDYRNGQSEKDVLWQLRH